MDQAPRFRPVQLVQFASELLTSVGLAEPLAQVTAETLVEGDLLGHDTHGLALLQPYVAELVAGSMSCAGSPSTLSDHDAALLWDGARLPGPWLVRTGYEALAPRARAHGSATLVIRRSHHIACLASYLVRAARDGLMMILASSDPAVHSVAPYGGTRGVFTPNPIAAAIPTSGDPILIDISASLTTNGMSARLYREGREFDEEWLLDAAGAASRDPAVLYTDPPGTILPLGGLSAGHKGFALALLVEALTGGLAGHGRADLAEGWGATVFMALFDPEAFAGGSAFRRQMDALVKACHDNPPRPGFARVRLPGERGLALWRSYDDAGVRLRAALVTVLEELAHQHGLTALQAL
jgi:LDH2 family malate/lactate/ureidoglycolate dehydrogenase